MGGAIYLSSGGSVNYCIFDNNTALLMGSAIYIVSGSVNVDYNFFAFQNNGADFPNLICLGANYIVPSNWVVLKNYISDINYVVDFVLNNGSALDVFMPDYTARLVIGSDEKIITIHNNTCSYWYYISIDGVYSLNSSKLLISSPKNALVYVSSKVMILMMEVIIILLKHLIKL